jgi:hypothetical protein
MNTGTLRRKLIKLHRNYGNSQVTLDFGGEHRNIGKISDLVGTDPVDTIIEAGTGIQGVDGLVAALAGQDPYGDAQLFIVDGDAIAYYEVASVLVFRESVWITAGAFLTGGG